MLAEILEHQVVASELDLLTEFGAPPKEQPVTALKRPRSRGRKPSGWVDRWR